MDDGFGGGHAAGPHRIVESGSTFFKIPDGVGGAQVAGLFLGALNQVRSGQKGALYIINEDVIGLHGFKIRIQKHDGNGEFLEEFEVADGHLRAKKDDAAAVGILDVFDLL